MQTNVLINGADGSRRSGGDRDSPGCWHLITCEYPPQLGGVSDYSYYVADYLACSGDQVHVWCPGKPEKEDNTHQTASVALHRSPERFRLSDLPKISRELNRFPGPRRLLVQWVPHGFGYRAMNVGFCAWLLHRARIHGDRVEVMVHEPHLRFGEGSWKQDAAAAVHRLMDVTWLAACRNVWMSIPSWERELKPFALGRAVPFEWLPVPSNVPVQDDADVTENVRRRYASGGRRLIGHFGTHNPLVVAILKDALPGILDQNPDCAAILIGAGGKAFRDVMAQSRPDLAGRIHASGPLPADEVSAHLRACDVMLQPYRDGVSARRGSVMAALSHGCAIVTTRGLATEEIWDQSGAVEMAAAGNTQELIDRVNGVLAGASLRQRLREAGKELYDSRFDISHTVAKLRLAAAQ